MHQLIPIAGLLSILALAAQIRVHKIAPPPPLAQRVRVAVTRDNDTVEVTFAGAPGMLLSFHGASWPDGVKVVEVSGPNTLVNKRDIRRYRLVEPVGPAVRLCHVWEQLTLREISLSIEVPARVPESAPTPTHEGPRPDRQPVGLTPRGGEVAGARPAGPGEGAT